MQKDAAFQISPSMHIFDDTLPIRNQSLLTCFSLTVAVSAVAHVHYVAFHKFHIVAQKWKSDPHVYYLLFYLIIIHYY